MRLLLYSALLFLAGCAMFVPADREGAMKLVRQAEEEASSRDFAAAARSISAAISVDPRNGSLYLQQGSLMERMDDPAGAREAYRTGLRRLAADDPLEPVVTWRLGLLYALKLDDDRQARRLLLSLPPDSALREDLLGILALQTGDPAGALLHFDLALAQAPDADQAATILYHLSLAHFVAGDKTRALGDLYHAANRARHPGLTGDVERLWTRLNAEMPAAHSSSPPAATIE